MQQGGKKILKRRMLRGILAVLPLLSGVLWGSFWVHCVAGMEDFYTGIALVTFAFAGGLFFRRLPGILPGKLGCWYIACAAFMYYDILLPAAFFFGACSRRKPSGVSGGRFFCGMIAGAFLGYCYNWALTALILCGILHFLLYRSGRKSVSLRRNLAAAAFNLAVVTAAVLFTVKPELYLSLSKTVPERVMAPITRLCSVGLTDRNKPDILLIAKRCPQLQMPLEFAVFRQVAVLPPGKMIPERYDLIIVEDYSAAIISAPHRLTQALKPGGILVVPRSLCNKFPDVPWRTLPGSREAVFTAAVPDGNRPLYFTGETIERNLSAQIKNLDVPENILLKGALSGLLIDFKSETVVQDKPLPVSDCRYWLWGGCALLILLEILLRNFKIRDVYCAGAGAVIFSLICGILLGGNEISNVIDGDWLLVIFAVGAFFVDLPFKLPVLRGFSLLSVASLWLWWFYPGFFTAALAMFFASVSFAGSKRYFRESKINCDFREAFIAICFAAGFLLCGYIHNMILSTLAAICAIKLWQQLRS